MGDKEIEGKLNYELDRNFIELFAKRMQTNKGKYAPYNWKQSMEIEKLKQALFRHTLEIMKDQYDDDGLKNGHLAAVCCNAMFIYYQLQNNVKEAI